MISVNKVVLRLSLLSILIACFCSFAMVSESENLVSGNIDHKDSSNNSGLNRRILPLNIQVVAGEKKNTLTNAMFGWRVDEKDIIIRDNKLNTGYENTIFIIEYDYDLNNAGLNDRTTIHVPQGSILVFQGGSFKNGIIDFHGASFDVCGKYNVFHNTKIIDPSTNIVYPEWFYENCRNSTSTNK